MFFHPSDVTFFKGLEIWTRNGLRGQILESVGLHGLMKALLSGKIKANDTACVSLYKRVYPTFPYGDD